MDAAQELELKAFSRQKAMNAVIDQFSSPVQQFYNGATVFVTGASGFLGKQLVEKLFRSTQVAKVYILLRCKKRKSIQERLAQMLADPVYEGLRQKQPNFADKIVPIEGDAADIRLGIKEHLWNTIAEEVDTIFHLAATTRFDEPVRVATLINVRGTREALLLAKACKNLRSFVHVSTAYTYACKTLVNTDVKEEFYPCPIDPEAMIKMVETMDEDRLINITPALIKDWPNTYTFAKAVSEELVRTLGAGLPICIVRPAIVIAVLREPNPGWIDISNVYGASGFVLGGGLGVMHAFYLDTSITPGLIPADYVNNAIVCGGWVTARAPKAAAGDSNIMIYTVSSSCRNPIEWANTREILLNEASRYPSPKTVWYPFDSITTNLFIFWLLSWFYHILPAYCVDGICFVLGKERRFVKLSKKMYKMCIALSYFTLNQWTFVDNNLETLFNSLSPVDKDIYNFDVTDIDWPEYLCTWCIGVRKYVIKDGLTGTEYARRKFFMLRIAHYMFMCVYVYTLYRVLSVCVSVLGYVFGFFL